jgi:hypothetical protein
MRQIYTRKGNDPACSHTRSVFLPRTLLPAGRRSEVKRTENRVHLQILTVQRPEGTFNNKNLSFVDFISWSKCNHPILVCHDDSHSGTVKHEGNHY